MTGVMSVSLAVRSLDPVAAFYQRVIGLVPIHQAPDRVVLGVGATALLELLHRPDALPRDPAAAGLFHTAFLLPSRDDLAAWLAHAASLGQALDGAADHLVSEAVYLHDPEGNGIEVCADRAPEAWTWTETPQGRHVSMANIRFDPAALAAQATRAWQGAPEGTRIGHVHLQGGSIPEATAFYTDVVGMDVTTAWPEAVFLSSGGYHHHLAVNTWNSAGAGLRNPRRAGLAAVTLGSGPGAPRADCTDPWGTVIRFASSST